MPTPTLGLIGRYETESTDLRANALLTASCQVNYCTGAIGTAKAELFESDDHADHGGVVLRLTIGNETSSFLPHALVSPNGVELHMAGDAEADALLMAIAEVLRTRKPAQPSALGSLTTTRELGPALGNLP